MSETPENSDSPKSERKLDPALRFKALLAKDFRNEFTGAEWNTVDAWRMQQSQLMHELTCIGISQGGSFGSEITVSRPDDRHELMELLMDLVARNRFQPSYDLAIHYDHGCVERECEIRIGELYWSMRRPFEAYWQGQYRSDASRLALLKKVVAEEKHKKDQWPLEERAWQWIERYFHGCCPQEVEVPEHQNPDALVQIFNNDLAMVQQLPLREDDLEEVERILKLNFIGGEYPIIVGKEDRDSEEAMLQVLQEIAVRPREASAQMDFRAVSITMVLQRYRQYVAQGLNFEEEEAQRKEEAVAQNTLRQQDAERSQQEYEVESAFLTTLSLAEWEAKEWPESLWRTANSSYFKVNPAHREQVHAHVRWFIERMPWADECPNDPWGPLTCMLKSYWTGHYHPDSLRWNVLQEECAKLSSGSSNLADDYGISTYCLHERYMKGCVNKCAKINAAQDPELLEMAYKNDMQLIHGFNLSEKVTREVEWKYNQWLLDGNLPLTLDREMPEDRETLRKAIEQHLEEMNGTDWEADPTSILQIFCDHWHPISSRPAPRKE